jgi:hypothetical protein
MPHAYAYWNIPFEQIARHEAEQVTRFLRDHPEILAKIRRNKVLRKADLQAIDEWKDSDRHEPLRKGFQFIHGVLVYVR